MTGVVSHLLYAACTLVVRPMTMDVGLIIFLIEHVKRSEKRKTCTA